MTNKVLECFKAIGLTPSEVEDLIDACPELKTLDAKAMAVNIELVIAMGYPREDMSTLICINPYFLLADANIIKNTLEQYDDVEEALKADPFII